MSTEVRALNSSLRPSALTNPRAMRGVLSAGIVAGRRPWQQLRSAFLRFPPRLSTTNPRRPDRRAPATDSSRGTTRRDGRPQLYACNPYFQVTSETSKASRAFTIYESGPGRFAPCGLVHASGRAGRHEPLEDDCQRLPPGRHEGIWPMAARLTPAARRRPGRRCATVTDLLLDETVFAEVRRLLAAIPLQGPIVPRIVDNSGTDAEGPLLVWRGAAVARPDGHGGKSPGGGESGRSHVPGEPVDRLAAIAAQAVVAGGQTTPPRQGAQSDRTRDRTGGCTQPDAPGGGIGLFGKNRTGTCG